MINKVSKSKLSVEDEFIKEAQFSFNDSEAVDNNLLSDEEVVELAKDNLVLEAIVKEIRDNSDAALDVNYRKIFLEVEKNNAGDILFLKEEIAASKDAFINKISAGKGFNADISRNKDLQEKYSEVFGKQSKVITFEDYNVLLEMKRVLEIEEQLAVNEFEKI